MRPPRAEEAICVGAAAEARWVSTAWRSSRRHWAVGSALIVLTLRSGSGPGRTVGASRTPSVVVTVVPGSASASGPGPTTVRCTFGSSRWCPAPPIQRPGLRDQRDHRLGELEPQASRFDHGELGPRAVDIGVVAQLGQQLGDHGPDRAGAGPIIPVPTTPTDPVVASDAIMVAIRWRSRHDWPMASDGPRGGLARRRSMARHAPAKVHADGTATDGATGTTGVRRRPPRRRPTRPRRGRPGRRRRARTRGSGRPGLGDPVRAGAIHSGRPRCASWSGRGLG